MVQIETICVQNLNVQYHEFHMGQIFKSCVHFVKNTNLLNENNSSHVFVCVCVYKLQCREGTIL
jgi:hypothetical protein